MPAAIEFERFNPFRHPDWRLERVLRMVDRLPNPGRSTPRDDDGVKGLRNFILRYRSYDEAGRNRLAYENPGLFWAYQIYDLRDEPEGRRKSAMVEARLLAGQSDEEIAGELHTIPGTVHWYEVLFFNVRDRLNAHDWVVDHVLAPVYEAAMRPPLHAPQQPAAATDDDEQQAPAANFQPFYKPISEPLFDCTLKFFGYFAGPFVLDYVISGFRRGSVARNRDDVGDWFDAHWKTRIRHRSAAAAQTFDVTRGNVMKLFEIHAQIVAIEQSAEGQKMVKDQLHQAIGAMLHGLPWAVGPDEGRAMVAGTRVAAFDDMDAELRDDELMLLSAGKNPGTIEGIEQLKLPPPRAKEDSNGDVVVGSGNNGGVQE